MNSRTSALREKSLIALAASAASPRTNVSAVGPSSSSRELLGARLLGGAEGQAVLDDAKRRVGLAQLRAQLGRLRHGDPAVVHGEDRLGVLELPGDLVDDRCLFVLVHARFALMGKSDIALELRNARTQAGVETTMDSVGSRSTCPGLLG